jgi:hypothetical protein
MSRELGPVTPDNYGRVAAARIAQARQERANRAPGQDLNQNEQAAIMDTYRRLAMGNLLGQRETELGRQMNPGEQAAFAQAHPELQPMSMVDTFAKTQHEIAMHQSDTLNLARATSAKFETSLANVIAVGMDQISDGWGTQARQNIADKNPYDPTRQTAAVGGMALPLLQSLTFKSPQAVAALMGVQSGADSLAHSEDTGETGVDKWGKAAGRAALTYGTVYAGSKLGSWATSALASRIPELRQLFASGNMASAGAIIRREAISAGINLPPQVGAMMAGTIGDNLISGRDWKTGLEDTALQATAFTLGTHVAKASADVAGVRTVRNNVLGGSLSRDGATQIDESIPRTFTTPQNVTVDVHQAINIHEQAEKESLDSGKTLEESHMDALRAEHGYLKNLGVDPADYEQFLAPYITKLGRGITMGDEAPFDQRQKAEVTRETPEAVPGEPTKPPSDAPPGTEDVVQAAIDGQPGRIQQGLNTLADTWNGFNMKPYPATHRVSRELGEAAVRLASADTAVHWEAADMVNKIVPPPEDRGLFSPATDPEASIRIRHALEEDNRRQIAAEKAANGDMAGSATVIGRPKSPFQTEAEYQAYRQSPEFKQAEARMREVYSPRIDELYRQAQGLSDGTDLPTRGIQSNIRVNLQARFGKDINKPGVVQTRELTPDEISKFSSYGNAVGGGGTRPGFKKSPLARQATGFATFAGGDMHDLIENSLGKTARISAGNTYLDQGIKDGVMVDVTDGRPPTTIGGQPVKYYPGITRVISRVTPEGTKTFTRTTGVAVRDDLDSDFRRAWGLDKPHMPALVKQAGDTATALNLAGITDGVAHVGNQATTASGLPVFPGRELPWVAKAIYNSVFNRPEFHAALTEMAQRGSLHQQMEIGSKGDIAKPWTWMGATIRYTDQIARLVHRECAQHLIDKGLVPDTDSARRDFENKLGQYNKKMQPWIIATARESGMAPFATATHRFNLSTLKSSALGGFNPEIQATSVGAALKMRAMVALRQTVLMGLTVAAPNLLRWGRADGADDVPLGAVRLDDGPNGEHRYFNVSNLTGLGRAMRITGMRAIFEGKRMGQTGPEIAKQATQDIAGAAISPFAGPWPNALSILASGKTLSGYTAAHPVGSDQYQIAEDLKAMVIHANPTVSQIYQAATTGKSVLGSLGGKFAPQEKAVPQTSAMKLASFLAAKQVPEVAQTEAAKAQTKAEHGYREAWAKGDQAPMLQAVERHEINDERALTLAREARMSPLARTVHGLNFDSAFRVYDKAMTDKEVTPQQRAELQDMMRQRLINEINAKSPKAQSLEDEFKKRGIPLE